MNDAKTPSIQLRPGDVLAGKYRVERVIGAGGMGVVLVAHHLQLDEKVALKFLLPQALESVQAVARFVSEARAAVRIKNEHVARVIDVGELENHSPYIVMEYLDGIDLAAWLKHEGVLPVEQAVDFILQACEALAEAHALGIVHRDLKPANLFCIQRADGQLSIKVLDFGISKITTPGAVGHEMTGTSALLGSPSYMSPEQMQQASSVDARTDVWSLGAILFELLTRRPPFTAEMVTALAIKVANEPAPPLRAFRADAPEALERAIAMCLQKDRAHRFQTVGELALALRELGPKHARVSVDRVLGTLRKAGMFETVLPQSGKSQATEISEPPLPEGPPQTAAPWVRTGPEPRFGGRAVVAFAGAVVLGVLAIAGVLLVHKTGKATTAPPATVVATPPPETASEAAQAPPLPSVDTAAHTAEPASPATSPTVPTSPSAKPAVARPHPANKATQPNCDPPYSYGPNGRVVFKKECL